MAPPIACARWVPRRSTRAGNPAPILEPSLLVEGAGDLAERGLEGEERCTGLARKEVECHKGVEAIRMAGGCHRGAEGIHMEVECRMGAEGRIHMVGGVRRGVDHSTAAGRMVAAAGKEHRTC